MLFDSVNNVKYGESCVISHFSFLISHFLCVPLHPLLSNSGTGEMVEWSITAVLKTAALRGAGGSNPSLSAKMT